MTDESPAPAPPLSTAAATNEASTAGAVSVRASRIIAVVVFFLTMVATLRPEDHVLGRLFVPDSMEYVAGGQRLATHGRYEIIVDGVAHPPRYPPGFSVLLAPAYLIAPNDFTAGVWIARAIWASGCAALSLALARRYGAAVALLAPAVINVEPVTARMASTIMSDAPSVGCLLALFSIRLLRPHAGVRAFAAAGVIIAVAVACRPVTVLYVLAFLLPVWNASRRTIAAAVLLAPTAIVVALTAAYNRATFGSVGMNGYAYWVPFPYARFDYVFHPTYLTNQLAAISNAPSFYFTVLAGCVAAIVISALTRATRREFFLPLALLVLPLTIAHGCYFFIQVRLFLPLIVVSMACVGVAIGLLLDRMRRGREAAAVIAMILTAVTLCRGFNDVSPVGTFRASVVAQMRQSLPERCNVITLLDSVLIETAVNRGANRRWIAATREQEYADKVIAAEPLDLTGIPRPPPLKHRLEMLIGRGARLAVPRTAEDESLLAELAAAGAPPLFIDVASLNGVPGLRARLDRHFQIEPVEGTSLLLKLMPRSP